MPPFLAGREEQINRFNRSLSTAISHPQNMILQGIRGTGKTVLLRKFEESCNKNRWLFVRREFNKKLNNEMEFITALLTDIIVKTHGLSLATKLSKPAIGFESAHQKQIGTDFIPGILRTFTGTLGDRLETILKNVHESVIEAGFKGLVLLYDEFHFIEDGTLREHYPLSLLLESFSHVQQENYKFFLVLSGLPTLFPNLVKAKTYSERMFSVLEIENLTEEASFDSIREPLEKSPIKFSQELIRKIVNETQGYPYFLQFYPFFLIQNISGRKLGLKDLQHMEPFLIKELDASFFSGRLNRASDAEQKILFEMAKLVPQIRTSELRDKLKISKNYLNQLLISLVEKGLLYRVRRGRYRFTLPLFEKYLLRKK